MFSEGDQKRRNAELILPSLTRSPQRVSEQAIGPLGDMTSPSQASAGLDLRTQLWLLDVDLQPIDKPFPNISKQFQRRNKDTFAVINYIRQTYTC